MIKNKILASSGIFLVLGVLVGYFLIPQPVSRQMDFEHMTIDEQRSEFLSEKDHMTAKMIAEGNYACCLERPCTYCIEKTPKHGVEATCTCLEDIMNGVHPCGECIGEILEGHGNKFLAKYFATALAEELGEQHKGTIQKIISVKYNILITDQL